jgi:class 3 adenylate cyclase/tetratricopeptide (TPR) repeat protein
MRCAKCGTENRDAAKFCDKCGARLSPNCPACGAENRADAKFCDSCGAALGPSPAHDAPSPDVRRHSAPGIDLSRLAASTPSASAAGEVSEGERKTITALFADIKGSTELEQDLDPEEARAIIDPALKLMIEAVRRYDGYIVQSTGDGIFALFGAPVAHEDHPQRALYAALRIHDENRRYADKLRAEGRAPLQIRIGADTGEVVLRTIETGGKTEYTPIGHAPNLASRMQSLANPGSTMISESTRKLVEGYFALKSLGASRVKGIAEPVGLYEVTGLGPLRSRLQRSAVRGYSKFVGRAREMEALTRAAELAKAGHGQIVAAVAEPGVGKSRLFFEFKSTSQNGWLVLEALSVSHGKATAYLPLIDLLHGYFEIEPEDEPRRRREKVAGKVTMLDRSLEDEALPHLFALFGIIEGEDPFARIDAQVRRRRTQDAIKRVLLRESLNQPLMVIFEDLHWIDEETQAFLNLLAEAIANAPVLMLVNYRPEYSHQWGSKTYYTQLRLDPLGQESADEMLTSLLGSAASLVPLKRLVLDRTEGNPLFMEELVEALFEEGALVRNGAVTVTRSLSQLKIPPTVQGILAARIDRLQPDEKELLQTLAVIGMEFPLSLVRQVVQQAADQIDHLLDHLQTAEFIYEQPAAGDVEYIFKHALTHDVAYNSLLTERRKLLHECTAQAIELLRHERLEDYYDDLAHHYSSSNNAARAIEYLRLAGEQAARRGAYAQALTNVEPALKLIERLPQGPERLRAELGVRVMQGLVAPALFGLSSDERLRTSERVCELSEKLGDEATWLRGQMNVAGAYLTRGRISRALEMARRCVELAQRAHNPETLAQAQHFFGSCLRISGDFVQASALFRDLVKHSGSRDPGVATQILPFHWWALSPVSLALVSHLLGRPDEALNLANEALRRARQLKHPFTLAVAFGNFAILRYRRREPDATRALAESVIASGEANVSQDWMANARSLRAWALAELGDATQIAELESNAGAAILPLSGLLARACMRAGLPDRALGALDEGLVRNERSGAHQDDADLHRLKGEAILVRDSSATAAAEECFRKAIEIACRQSAKIFELSATTSLARLLRDTGRRDEARTMLADIYGWFTEGFDTADLKDAKALLDELAG